MLHTALRASLKRGGRELTKPATVNRCINVQHYSGGAGGGSMEAYGFFMEPTPEHPSKWYSPSETVAALMKMYQELTEKSNG